MTSQSQDLFSGMENLLPGHGVALSEFVGSLPFNEAGLLPAITQDVESGEVLMLAWMNREALEKTIASGRIESLDAPQEARAFPVPILARITCMIVTTLLNCPVVVSAYYWSSRLKFSRCEITSIRGNRMFIVSRDIYCPHHYSQIGKTFGCKLL